MSIPVSFNRTSDCERLSQDVFALFFYAVVGTIIVGDTFLCPAIIDGHVN